MRKFCIADKVLFPIVLWLCSAVIYADEPINDGDCPLVMPDFSEMILLTREERIQLMDQALKDALSQVQECKQRLSEIQKQNSSSAASNSSGTSADTSTNSDSNSESENANNGGNNTANGQNRKTAVPSGELSGTETSEPPGTSPIQTTTPSDELSGDEPAETKPEDATASQSSDKQADDETIGKPDDKTGKEALNNGKLPEDIPPADNDDIIARQIREEALAESDPQKQAKLWNEYRRYKEIPEK